MHELVEAVWAQGLKTQPWYGVDNGVELVYMACCESEGLGGHLVLDLLAREKQTHVVGIRDG